MPSIKHDVWNTARSCHVFWNIAAFLEIFQYMKTLLRRRDHEYEDSDILKHSRWLGSSFRDILDANGHWPNIFVHDIIGLYQTPWLLLSYAFTNSVLRYLLGQFGQKPELLKKIHVKKQANQSSRLNLRLELNFHPRLIV